MQTGRIQLTVLLVVKHHVSFPAIHKSSHGDVQIINSQSLEDTQVEYISHTKMNTLLENTLLENTLSEDTLLETTLLENTLLKNTLYALRPTWTLRLHCPP